MVEIEELITTSVESTNLRFAVRTAFITRAFGTVFPSHVLTSDAERW